MLIAIYQGHTYTQTHKIQKYFQIQLLFGGIKLLLLEYDMLGIMWDAFMYW